MLIWNVVENSKSRRSSLKLDYARKTSKESDFEKSFVKSFGFYSAPKTFKILIRYAVLLMRLYSKIEKFPGFNLLILSKKFLFCQKIRL